MTANDDRTACGGTLVLGVSTHPSGGLHLRVPACDLYNFAYLVRVFVELYIDQAMRAGQPYAHTIMLEALRAQGWGPPRLDVTLAKPIDDGRRARIEAIRMRDGQTAWGIVQYPDGAPLRARVVPPGDTMSAADVAELLDLWCGQWCGYRRGVTLELNSRDDVINRFWSVEGARDALTTRIELG